MSLITATTDFLRTLTAVPGNWGKLRYLAGLRKRDGEYHHWGLERTHGATAALGAIDEAHQSVMTEVLRSPLRELVEDVELSSQEAGTDPNTFVQQVQSYYPQHLPNAAAPVTPRAVFMKAFV